MNYSLIKGAVMFWWVPGVSKIRGFNRFLLTISSTSVERLFVISKGQLLHLNLSFDQEAVSRKKLQM